ncbi:pyruvate dehydrogenase E1 component subunit alpha [Capsulimonas corticalis]|uniref:Pyruvate dehydrogenase E1 component subunit alpha n=1 Tax=Capsulimonas corticalis TaxID=2219043 RepID=A0A402CSK4_9BACT|nr:thiamine pyrophosphate-dependent enzyme [Capsulimonas corticalis]BDI31052.1 pyruvate dehydrogenase E1 component subunit alpha [Capsulimonas corticalis]
MAASPAALKTRGSTKYDAHGAEIKDAQVADADAVIAALKLTDEQLLLTYQRALEVRHFEEQCNRAFRANKVGGYLHLYIGQEAVSLGVLEACKQGDQVLSSYRDHAHCLILGSDPNAVMAEIYGKSTGISRGKGGSMHLFDKANGFAGGYGIVGGNVPLAVGIGWALKYKNELKDNKNICVCYLGDGSMNAGAFHEALNMAALYELPILYVLENNKYAMGTSVERHSANTDLSSRADSYNMRNSKVDGQDYFAVRKVAQEIIDEMRVNPAPYFLEAVTYRYVGHGAADGAGTQITYRDPSELEEWKKRDPINILGDALRKRGTLTEAKHDELDKSALEIARVAAEFADNSPVCAPEELTQDVYVD